MGGQGVKSLALLIYFKFFYNLFEGIFNDLPPHPESPGLKDRDERIIQYKKEKARPLGRGHAGFIL